MFTTYYKYPLDVAGICSSSPVQKCSKGEAISQNLQLMILCAYGTHRYNKTLGCAIHELDFDLIMHLRLWEEQVRNSLLKTIAVNEPALHQTAVDVKVSEAEHRAATGLYPCIKRQVTIIIHAVLKDTGEKYYFNTQFFLSPVSGK